MPHYAEILEFIDLRVRASKIVFRECPKCHHSQPIPSKNSMPIETIYVANVDTACMSCGVGKHPLYVCRKFGFLLPEQRMDLIRKLQLCNNCLQSNHYRQQCASNRMCQECHKPHHTLLHSQFEPDSVAKTAGQATKELLPKEQMTLLQVTAPTCPVHILGVIGVVHL